MTRPVSGMCRAPGLAMIATPVTPPAASLTRAADHPRYLEVAVGRLLEMAVHSIEGVRDRLRGRTTVH